MINALGQRPGAASRHHELERERGTDMKSMTAVAHNAAGTKRPRRRSVVLFAGVVTAVAVFSATSTPAFSADNGTIDATVTPATTACLTVNPSSHDFGAKPFMQPGGVASNGDVLFTVTNCGTALQKLYGRGTDAHNAANSVTWTLQQGNPCGAGPNNYRLLLDHAPEDAAWSGFAVLLTKTDQQLLGGGGLPGTASIRINATVQMPCAGSGGAGQAMSFQYVITAALL